MPDRLNSSSPHTFRTLLKAIGAFAFLVTVFMAGFAISSSYWASSNAALQSDLRHAQEGLSNAKQELADVKSEYAIFRQKSGFSESGAPVKEVRDTKPARTDLTLDSQNGRASETISVGTEHTAYAFNGQIFVALAATPFEGDPLRHKVIATVGSPGFPSITLARKDVGFSTTYKAKDNFEVMVTAASTFSAEFRVTKLSK